MEENTQKFEEKLKELIQWGKKKKSILELQEINDFFHDMELDPEQMEKVYERLEANNIDDIKAKTEALTEKFHTISAKMYQQAQAAGAAGADPNMGAAGAAGAGAADAGAQPKDDNVVDADYEVVDDDK